MIDIILPVYNKEKVVSGMLKSLEALNDEYFYITFIDDGSTDGTFHLLERYALNRENVKVIHKDNGGVSSARNYGISNTKNEYIWFCDPDDEIEASGANSVAKFIESEKVDMAVFGYHEICSDGTSVFHSDNGKYSGDEFIRHFDYFRRGAGISQVCPIWNKIFTRSAIGDIRFDERISYGEDRLFNLMVLAKSARVYCYNAAIYRYIRYEEGTLSTTISRKFINDLIFVNERNLLMHAKFFTVNSSSIFRHLNQVLTVVSYNFSFYERLSYAVGYCRSADVSLSDKRTVLLFLRLLKASFKSNIQNLANKWCP